MNISTLLIRSITAVTVAVSIAATSPDAAVAQGPDIGPGDLLRITTYGTGDGASESVFSGRLQSLRDDSLFVETASGGAVISFPTSVLASPGHTVEVRRGTKALKYGLVGGLVSAAAGFPIGYCFQVLSDECAKDNEAAFATAAVFGAVGGGVGALIGSFKDRYEPVDPTIPSTRITPHVGLDGGIGFRGQIRLPRR